MAELTKPKDLAKPASQKVEIIKQIEADFKRADRKPYKWRDQFYHIITVRGFFEPMDIDEVVKEYKDIGWEHIEVYRSYAEKGKPAQLTKFKFYEVY